AMRQAGVCLAATVEEAFDAAATFATQPLPAGPNTVVVTTAGGWGVMTADALTGSSLRLIPLPDDLRAAVDTRLPPRWSPANPGPAAVRDSGRYCYPSANRAVTALEHLWRYARHRQRRSG